MRKKQTVPFAQKFPNADPLALRLLERLLAFDPKDRPTAEEVLHFPKESFFYFLYFYHCLLLLYMLSQFQCTMFNLAGIFEYAYLISAFLLS